MLSTIGYESAKLSDFIKTLQMAGIELVVDVRDRAQSRRPGFSKSSLSSTLKSFGIEYTHYRELGDPKEGREAARSNDLDRFRQIFSSVLATDEARQALQEIVAATSQQSVCLLCYERDQSNCHRALIASEIEAITGKKARHLGVREFEPALERG